MTSPQPPTLALSAHRGPAEASVPRADGSGTMFDGIAERYDRLNTILSLGNDRRWRRAAVGALDLPPNARVLDLATGTADLALAIARRHPDAAVTGLDPSLGMVRLGSRKIRDASCAGVSLELGDAETLPFGDATFDGVTIAFGIRNVPDRPRALVEMARVLKPQGRLAILELSEPEGGLLGAAARFHTRHLVPRIGGWLSGQKEYRYLQASVAAFPPPAEFARMMEAAGLRVLEQRPLTFGACHLYLGTPA